MRNVSWLLLGISLAPTAFAAGKKSNTQPAAASPTVTRAHRTGESYGPPVPPDIASQAQDNPAARQEWYFHQRAYPFATIPAGAYGRAADAYVQGRSLTRQRDQQLRSGRAPAAPLAPPTGPWAEVGPAPISNNVVSTFGAVSGRISAVAIHPANPAIALIGASRGGLWRTADVTAANPVWIPVGDGQNTLVIADIKFAPSNPNIVYAGTGDDDSSFWGAGVLKSTDAGLTWARADNGTPASGITNGTVLSKLAVDPANPNIVVAASRANINPADNGNYFHKIFRTADGGATWSQSVIPNTDGIFRSMVIESGCPTNLWAVNGRDQTLNRSTDGGANWAAVATTGLPAFTGNSKITVYHPSCVGGATLFLSVHSGDGLAGSAGYPGVYRSLDNGATWALPGLAAGPSGGCLGQCDYDHELLVDPADPTRLYQIGRDIWTSIDGGQTWGNRSAGFDDAGGYFGGNMHVDLHDVTISGSGAAAAVYVAGDGGLWSYSIAGNSFTNRNGNLAISEIIDLAVRPDVPGQAVAGLQDNGSISYNGAPVWTARLGGDGGASGWLRSTPGAGNPFDGAFTTYIRNTGYKSTDAGATWAAYGNAAAFANETAEFYGPWLGTVGNNRLWHAAQSLWFCDFPADCAPTWTKMGATNLAAMTSSAYVSKLAIHNPAAGVFGPFYAGNFGPRAFLYSADGITWVDRTGTLPDRTISNIVLNPAAPQQVWVTVSGFATGHIFYSGDSGATWADKSGNFPNIPVNAILIDPLDPANTWYIGTDIGVYATANAGVTWSVVGNNLPACAVLDLELDQNRLLYAATGGRSVWTILLTACSLPGAVGNSVNSVKAGGGAQLTFTWADIGGATGYKVFEDAGPNGPFTTLTGAAASGNPGLTVNLPPGGFFRVAATNACGDGPK